ncbi:MAG: NAD(P)H-hydrate dehydratase [Alphaproteobacteria bacterium]|nr:NAD(P)H-hydrate dehydratase [Alphaproteobacteria bacterium]
MRCADQALLTCAEMARADRAAIESGIPGIDLMEAAGAAVAREIQARFARCALTVVCGPGNNGGDGFVVARHLHDAGWNVRVGLLGDRAALRGDAAAMAARWNGGIEEARPALLAGAELVVDALFGAGLSRPLDGPALALVGAMGTHRVVAIDVPSGVSGDTGAVMGAAPSAELTVTFFRRKPGHLLYPGRGLCGEIVLADIGIPRAVLDRIEPANFANERALWIDVFPVPAADGHKYDRGHAVVVGGPILTGAARLAARAAARIGAGLVTIAADPRAVPLYSAGPASLMVRPMSTLADFVAVVDDPRRNVVLLGPGNGADAACAARVRAALAARKACILDADALSAFSGDPPDLFARLNADCVITPHDGEFARLFPDIAGDRLSRARQAAGRANAVVLLKGADTAIAEPGGRAAINANAPPWLATAGSGDVLAGLIAGLRAQGMSAFDAACAAANIHGAAAARFGPGLVADDLPEQFPAILAELYGLAGHRW